METIFNALTFLGNEVALFIISMIPARRGHSGSRFGHELDRCTSRIGHWQYGSYPFFTAIWPQNPRLVENHSLFFQNGPLV